MALTLPDICGRIAHPGLPSGQRYVRWFDSYLLANYQMAAGPNRTHTFLCGSDCYALRCAYLHQGEFDLTDQRAAVALEYFVFIEPPASGLAHLCQGNKVLMLQIDCFCEEVCQAVDRWLSDVQSDPAIQGRVSGLARIKKLSDGVTLL